MVKFASVTAAKKASCGRFALPSLLFTLLHVYSRVVQFFKIFFNAAYFRCSWQREKNRERQRQIQTENERERERDRQTDTHTQTETDTQTDRQKKTRFP